MAGASDWRLYCSRCGFRGPPSAYYPWCPRCGGPLEVEGKAPRVTSVLGEGGTPLVEADGFRAKLEYLNPTGSFKDRGVSYSLQVARLLGFECSVVDSSGNTGVSVAAYSGRLGLRARVYVPRSAGEGKKRLIRLLGAELVEAGDREEASRLAREEASRCFHVAHQTNPFFLEGMKSLGRELADVVEGSDVIVPVSSGSLILGIHRGLREAEVEGYRLIAVQNVEAASLRGRVGLLAEVGGSQGRLMDALVVRRPARLDEIAEAVNSTGGGLVVVGDDAVRHALKRLLASGFIVEPSSASVYAAMQELERRGLLRGEPLLVLTGSGLKYSQSLQV